jgi:hypothetical protein
MVFVSVDCSLKPFDRGLPLLLITYYPLLQRFPGLRAFFVVNADYLVNDLVDLFHAAEGYHNAGLVEDLLKMAKVARHVMLLPYL